MREDELYHFDYLNSGDGICERFSEDFLYNSHNSREMISDK